MARPFITPKLADVTQDIAGPIPVDLIKRWAEKTKSPQAHQKLLSDFLVRGTVVVSDSSGLSKLAKSRSLLEVMWLVHKPKETIYSFGKALGGRPIGIWAADNTEMFYDVSINPATIVDQLVSVQQRLHGFPIQVGLAVHAGEFIEIGGGLYGEEADFVESIGESHTDGGEITLTDEVADMIPDSFRKHLVPNNDREVAASTYDFAYESAEVASFGTAPGPYPAPFPQDFYDLLSGYERNEPEPAGYRKYKENAVVVLVKIHHPKRVFLLDTLADWVLANTIIEEVRKGEGIREIKSNGSLAIFISQNPKHAIDFARFLYEALDSNAYAATVGLSQGEVLVFPLEHGSYDIAGGPVNIASKLAEDAGVNSGILIEESVSGGKKGLKNFQDFTVSISGVAIHGLQNISA